VIHISKVEKVFFVCSFITVKVMVDVVGMIIAVGRMIPVVFSLHELLSVSFFFVGGR